MCDKKNNVFKLFGRNIQLYSKEDIKVASRVDQNYGDDNYDCDYYECITSNHNSKHCQLTTQLEKPSKEEQNNTNNQGKQPPKLNNGSHSTITDDSKTASNDKEYSSKQSHNNKLKKTLKKSDKILACPRCKSMSTKFCYFNNYNVNQPRHFCKDCQRYWTAGGTMRTVPVGSGRRKNKNTHWPRSRHRSSGSIQEHHASTKEIFECFPAQVANSSTWNTLRNKKNVGDTAISKAGFFGVYDRNVKSLPVLLEFNPAAMSRSLLFHEIQ